MIAAARVLGAAAAGAALLIAGATAEPASAQENASCRDNFVTASGRGKFRPFTKTKELEGRGSAMTDAVAAWEREVASTIGDKWKRWDDAKDKTFECAPTKSGKIIGSSFIGCTIRGRPCAGSSSSGEETAASADRRTRDRDRGLRDDDGDRRSSRDGYSWRYRLEMRRQEGLAQWRHRSEDRAWEREQAHQRYLQAQRDRAEQIARQRAEVRERYFARERD